jgi:outer membrane biosynthesis protein TonB
MAFVNTFMKNLSLSIGDLAKWLEEQHQVPTAEIINKWNDLTGMNIVLDENDVDVEDVGHVAVSVNRSKSNKKNLTCKHVFINGKRRGQQCVIKPKGGAEFCSSHKIKAKDASSFESSEDEAKKQPKKPTKPTKTTKTDNKSKEKTKAKKSPETVPTSDSDSEPEPQEKTKSKKSPKTVPTSDSDSEPPKKKNGVLSHSVAGPKTGNKKMYSGAGPKSGNKTSSDSDTDA